MCLGGKKGLWSNLSLKALYQLQDCNCHHNCCSPSSKWLLIIYMLGVSRHTVRQCLPTKNSTLQMNSNCGSIGCDAPGCSMTSGQSETLYNAGVMDSLHKLLNYCPLPCIEEPCCSHWVQGLLGPLVMLEDLALKKSWGADHQMPGRSSHNSWVCRHRWSFTCTV